MKIKDIKCEVARKLAIIRGGRPNQLLIRAFIWANTPEGAEYWNRVNSGE